MVRLNSKLLTSKKLKKMRTKVIFPFAYRLVTVVIIAMLGLTIWQFTFPEKNPVMIMVSLCGGGMLSCFIVGIHRIKHSHMPFSAVAGPMGITFFWIAAVFLGIGIWIAVKESVLQVGIVMSAIAGLLAFFGYQTLKK